MKFTDALPVIADYLNINADELLAYTFEDKLLGKDDVGEKPGYIPFRHDGQLLYALVRILKPRRIFESGVDEGGSINHMATALIANGDASAHITGVDIRPDGFGSGVHPELRAYYDLVSMDIKYYTPLPEATDFDFIHEDSAHEVHTVRAVYEYLPTLMPRGGVIVSHDLFTGVGEAIKTGIRDSGFEGKPLYIKYDESPCGWAIMRYTP